jgi:hypothetical protein
VQRFQVDWLSKKLPPFRGAMISSCCFKTVLFDSSSRRAMVTTVTRTPLMETHDIVENWRREAIQEGVKQGLEQGERKLLLQLLRRRFGAAADGEIERRVAVASATQLELWADRVLSAATLAELLED